MSADISPKLGLRLVCPVCGAQVTVAQAGCGSLGVRCCNQPMLPLQQRTAIWHCSICGREVMVVRDGGGELALSCCNRPMRPLL